MRSTISSWWALSGPTISSASSSPYPVSAVSGVRSSCEIVVRNDPFRVACRLRFLQKSRLHEHDGSVIGDRSESLPVSLREDAAVVAVPCAEQANRLIRGDERSDGDLADARVGREDRTGQRWIVVLDDEGATAKRVTGERVADVEERARVRRLGA